ncbi:MAG TPA: hypothetical protein VFK06_10925 [Candidatus Angelobacter sp.]|nr:hypothetical protein [Candidatus Angelobacter sp.]
MRSFAGWIWPVMASCILLAGCSAGNKAQAGTASSAQPLDQKAQEEKDLEAWGRGERWLHDETIDKMDGHKTVSWTAMPFDIKRDEDNPQILSVSCQPEVTVFLISKAARDGVRMKLDDAAPTHENWVASNRWLGPVSYTASRDTLRRLIKAQTVKIEFTPIGGIPVVETFRMGNLKELIDKDKQYCKL